MTSCYRVYVSSQSIHTLDNCCFCRGWRSILIGKLFKFKVMNWTCRWCFWFYCISKFVFAGSSSKVLSEDALLCAFKVEWGFSAAEAKTLKLRQKHSDKVLYNVHISSSVCLCFHTCSSAKDELISSYWRAPANDRPLHCPCSGLFRSCTLFASQIIHVFCFCSSWPLSHSPHVTNLRFASISWSLVMSDSYYVSYQIQTCIITPVMPWWEERRFNASCVAPKDGLPVVWSVDASSLLITRV